MQSTKMALGSSAAIRGAQVVRRPAGLRAALPIRMAPKAVAAPAEELLGQQAVEQQQAFEVRARSGQGDRAPRGPEGAGGAPGGSSTRMHGARPSRRRRHPPPRRRRVPAGG